MRLSKELEKVSNREEFTKFLSSLANDFKINPNEWENSDVESFLQGVESWVEDMDGYYENNNIPAPGDINWNFIATLFYVGKLYE